MNLYVYTKLGVKPFLILAQTEKEANNKLLDFLETENCSPWKLKEILQPVAQNVFISENLASAEF